MLRHRIVTNFNAEAEGVKPDDIVARLTEIIPSDDRDTADRRVPEVFKTAGAGVKHVDVQ